MSAMADLERRFWCHLHRSSPKTIRTGDLVASLSIAPRAEFLLLSRLARRRLVCRLRRGLYLVPPSIPAGDQWIPDDATVLAELMKDASANWQISGLRAFSRYGWDDQIPVRTFVYNDRLSGTRSIASQTYDFAKLNRDRLGATTSILVPGREPLVFSSRARSLLDAVYDWERFNTLPRAYAWIESELRNDRQFASELTDVALRFGNQASLRRIGRALEITQAPELLLRKIERALNATSCYIPWNPTRPKRGRIDKRWMILVNDST